MQAENTAQKATDISSAIVDTLLLACSCPYSLEHVTHSRLLCGAGEKEFIYQSNLLNTDQMEASELMALVQLWVDNDPIITVGGVASQVDNYCQVSVSGIGEPECVALNPTTATTVASTVEEQSTRPSYLTGAIAGGVVGGAAIVILLFLIVVILCACRRSAGQEYDRSKAAASSIL